jgi:hypothetical protein
MHYSFYLSELSALTRLGLLSSDDFKGRPPHWLLGVLKMPGKRIDHFIMKQNFGYDFWLVDFLLLRGQSLDHM